MTELIAGELAPLRPGVHRILAPNPSVLTGEGTNTYLIGQRNITLLDPGPDMPEHLDAIDAGIAKLGGQLERIVVTHTHTDHSPGAAALAKRHGVPVVGCDIDDDGYQDASFKADVSLSHGMQIDVDGEVLEAIHTPGHVGNHYCLLHHPSGVLFTGDHIMQGSTVVIIPPSGDMADYCHSLRLLLDYPLAALAPGHGHLIDRPRDEIETLLAHRQGREDKVVAAMISVGEADLDTLLPVAYEDVPASIWPVARLSLLAHVLKLQREGRAVCAADRWRLK
ncbi:MBL fold metallo-hydrolase [Spongiibacter taiwanensis]|uniref:MBL fold metallo-hydrolase n=1 Tax=Spongiibacter taiwanensis TaxID=1748242 RepID=UPI0020353341|nr:MBL fold metallo-hydrolase [Spongiibacter taiwanensis]USA43869.1 MBL fold metallo-hydrolase [Spongiibacter taiwanensis]